MSQSERDTHFAGFARRLWEEMLSQTAWQGIDVTAGHIPLHHPEDEEHQIYIQIIARRAYDLVYHDHEHISHIDMDRLTTEEQITKIPDFAEWPITKSKWLDE